jgi:hypothetical protein
MTNWRETDEAAEFIATGDSRETSREIMQAVAFFAHTLGEAEELWNGDGFGRICNPSDLWEHVTGNGRRDPTEFCWGAAGSHWWNHIQSSAHGDDGMGEKIVPEVTADDLVLCRSDTGDGGWSLHAPGSTDEQIASGDAPYLVSGEAEQVDGEWSRPDAQDYRQALTTLVGKMIA